MKLNGGANRELIDLCLKSLEEFFEEDAFDRQEATDFIYQAFFEICSDHGKILADPDSAVELMVECFLRPLEAILPDSLNLAAEFVVASPTKYQLKMISKDEMNLFIRTAAKDQDKRVKVIDNHFIVVRMDKKL